VKNYWKFIIKIKLSSNNIDIWLIAKVKNYFKFVLKFKVTSDVGLSDIL
jgi:hypothetical protein